MNTQTRTPEARKRPLAHAIVPREEWVKARKELLKKEKEFTRQRDELSRQRRALPWVKVEKPYGFDTPHGSETLADLFDGRSQLIIDLSCSVLAGKRAAMPARF